MKEFFSFLKTKTFFKHFGLALLALCLILFLLFKLLSVYTNHGDTVEVPDFKGQPIGQLDKFVDGKDVRYQIIDSIYSPNEKPGVVLKQDPLPKVQVKHNRKIYLYVTSQLPPQIEMPMLVDKSLREAISTIRSYELKLDPKIKKVAGECNGCVLKQIVDGKEQRIKNEKGEKNVIMVKKGTVVQLVIGEGESDDRIVVPDLIGLTYDEAVQKLSNNNLAEGTIVPDAASKNMAKMFVYKQVPAAAAEATIRVGSGVDLYLTSDKSKIDKD